MAASDWPVEVDPLWGCWSWRAHTDKRDGSGMVLRGGKPYAAYRAVYESEVGDIGAGLVLAHQCLNRSCCAPHHVEAVPKAENERQRSFGYRMKRKRCKAGHDLERTRIVTPWGGVACRQCNREALEIEGPHPPTAGVTTGTDRDHGGMQTLASSSCPEIQKPKCLKPSGEPE